MRFAAAPLEQLSAHEEKHVVLIVSREYDMVFVMRRMRWRAFFPTRRVHSSHLSCRSHRSLLRPPQHAAYVRNTAFSGVSCCYRSNIQICVSAGRFPQGQRKGAVQEEGGGTGGAIHVTTWGTSALGDRLADGGVTAGSVAVPLQSHVLAAQQPVRQAALALRDCCQEASV